MECRAELKTRCGSRRILAGLILCAVCAAVLAAGADARADAYGDVPQKETPKKLRDSWLRFHENGMCGDIDAEFVFEGPGMRIWSRIEGEKESARFRKFFEPLIRNYRVEIYINRPREWDRAEIATDPPPGLWQNQELRYNLGDRLARSLRDLDFDEDSAANPYWADALLKQRLLVYAEQTLKRNRKMEHGALHLFALVRAAFDPAAAPDFRARAIAAGSAHAKELEKNIEKLAGDLRQATPGSGKGNRASRPDAAPDPAAPSLPDAAERLYADARGAAGRVHRFIYPEQYTVELGELRTPGLLESLARLQRKTRDLRRALEAAARR